MHYKILVAEDEAESRSYITMLLEQSGHQVVTAENGKIAFQKFQKELFDLVITDLSMPEMNGLTLLRLIKNLNHDIPVVFVSGLKDIEMVVEALRNGACDYLTKPFDEDDILGGIERAARFIIKDQAMKTCASYLKDESKRYIFDNQPELINSMARFICQDLQLQFKDTDLQSVQLALIEALNNAVFHGNLEVDSAIKQNDDISSFERHIKTALERLKKEPYKSRKVYINYSLSENNIEIKVRDEGKGFDFESLPDPLDPDSFINPSGRGLLMIRTFCDEVKWNDTGNEITLIKHKKAPVPDLKNKTVSNSEAVLS